MLLAFLVVIKYLNRKYVKWGRIYLGSGFEGIVHPGEEEWSMWTEVCIWDSSSHLREQGSTEQGILGSACLSPLPCPYIQSRLLVHGMVLSTFGEGLVCSINHLQKCPSRHAQKPSWQGALTFPDISEHRRDTFNMMATTSNLSRTRVTSPSRSRPLGSFIWNVLACSYLSDNKWCLGICSRQS